MKKALICGVSGQDGSYLAKLLLNKGYIVIGSSRDAQLSSFDNLKRLNIFKDIELISLAPNDFRSVLQVLRSHMPDEIYNLSGQSSVGLSFDQPIETMESIAASTLNFLEAIRFLDRPMKYYNAGTGECFGDTSTAPATEKTPFHPRSPYAVAKAAAHWHVANYRTGYNMFACTGILFNHESCLRPERFVTRKIIEGAKRIACGSDEILTLGNTNIVRDWGWAPEYVEAMWRMLQQPNADDFVIATGTSMSLSQFIEKTFSLIGRNSEKYVKITPQLMRPNDLMISSANPAKAKQVLNWQATKNADAVIAVMIEGVL